MTQIASVYAQALYSLGKDEGVDAQILSQIETLKRAFDSEPDYLRLLSALSLSKEERCQIIDDSFAGKIQPYLLNFMKILTEKGYIAHFPDCCIAYRNLYNEDNGIITVKAVTAVPLSKEQAQRLSAKLEKMTGKRIDLVNQIDPDCMGGVRLDYEGTRIDDTIAHRLKALHSMLKNTIL